MSSFYDDASWVLIPSGIKEDVIYAQKPDSGLGDLVMTRASDATYTDASGVVRRSPYNLVTFSEMFTDASWVKTSSTITANTISAPNGTLTADTLTASSSFPRVVQNPTIQANQSYRISTYAKAGSASVFTIFVSVNAVTLVNNVQYNLSTGVVTGSGTMQDVGNGWYLCSATFTVGASTASPDIRFFNHAQGITGGWSGSNFFYAWGAQLVEGTSALDYFPTTNRQDVPRIDFRNADGTLSSCGRLLLEPQRTNSIRNSSMVGAVAGTPGTLPTNWDAATSAGLTRTIVGIGTEIGLPYIDFRFNGTAIGDSLIVRFDSPTAIAASNGQTWSESVYIKKIAEPAPPTSYRLGMLEYTGAGVYIRIALQTITATTTLQRVSFTNTLSGGAGVGAVQAVLQTPLTIGQSYDFTIRIAAPQMELGAYATTWVPTTTAAVTRLADSASKTGVSSLINGLSGTLFLECKSLANDGTTKYFSLNDGTTSKEIVFQYTSTANSVGIRYLVGGIPQVDTTYTIPNALQINKFAYTWEVNKFELWFNGAKVISDTSGSVTTGFNQIDFRRSNGTLAFLSEISSTALFQKVLTDAELAQLTTL